jgi:hypothetical protein
MRFGPAALAAGALEHAAEGEYSDGGREAAEDGAARERDEREDVDVLRAEAPRRPAGERDDGGEGEQVPGDDPLDVGEGRVQVVPEGVESDVDDRRVEDRHDRPEHDDGSDAPDVRLDGCRVRGLYEGFGQRLPLGVQQNGRLGRSATAPIQ